MKSDCRVVKTTAILTKLRKGFSHSQILAKDLWRTQEFKKHEQLDTFCNLASTLHSASGCSWNSAPVSPVIFWQDGPLRQRISSSIDGRNRSRSPPPKAGMDSTTLQRIRSVSSKFLQSPWASEQDRPWSQERTVLKTSKRLQTVTRATKFEQFFQPIWWFLQSAGISGAAQFSISRSWSQCPMRWRSLTTDARCEIRCVDQQRLVWNLTRRVKKKLGWNNCQFCWSTPDRPSPFSETFDRSRVSTISSPLKEKRIKQWESCNEHMQQGRYVIVQDVPTKCETFHFAAVWPIYLGPILLLKFPLQVGKLPLLLGSKFLTFPSERIRRLCLFLIAWSPCDRDVGIQRPTRCTPGPSSRITACWAARNSSREAPRSFCTSWVPCWKLTCSFPAKISFSKAPGWDEIDQCRWLPVAVPKGTQSLELHRASLAHRIHHCHPRSRYGMVWSVEDSYDLFAC